MKINTITPITVKESIAFYQKNSKYKDVDAQKKDAEKQRLQDEQDYEWKQYYKKNFATQKVPFLIAGGLLVSCIFLIGLLIKFQICSLG